MFERGPRYLESKEKRALDAGVSCLALFFATPLIGILSFIKYVEDGENPFFVQDRIGKDGKIFKVIKIRSMKSGSEPDEVRTTKFGKLLRKTHMDELPQFFLVLSGQMSLVGPRPVHVNDLVSVYDKVSVTRYEEIIGDHFNQESGLTGVSQIFALHGKNHKFYHPNRFYSENASLMLDLKILAITAQKVLGSLNRK